VAEGFTFAVILVLSEFGIDGIPYNKVGTLTLIPFTSLL
jgi:hypothetical protein